MQYITGSELFERVAAILQLAHTPSAQTRKMVFETLMLVCQAGLNNSRHGFGNLSSQIDSLCKRHHVATADTASIQAARRHAIGNAEVTAEDLRYDCRALSLFISAVTGEAIPSTLIGKIPPTGRIGQPHHQVNYQYIRCTVVDWNQECIRVSADQEGVEELLQVDYVNTPDYINLKYLPRLLRQGMQLNLLNCEVKNKVVVPLVVVVEPDFLIDISVLASCFEDYGHHPLLYTLKRMMPRPNNIYTLMGNFAGAALDNIINRPANHHLLADTLKENFRDKALEFATCQGFNPSAFKQEATMQTQNLQSIVDDLFQHHNRKDAILEPSFICEKLGLQGRVDLMTTDFSLLVEQKSGKNINVERNTMGTHGKHIEKHYVQMLLYYGMLVYNFGLARRKTDMFLLYSKYQLPGGLLEVEPLQKLLREAIQLRNEVVATEYVIANEGFETILQQLTPQTMNTAGMQGFFFERYLLPQLDSVCAPLHAMTPLEHDYFCRMATFAAKETLLAKVGVAGCQGGAVADLWNMSLEEKLEMGNIYVNLQLNEKLRNPQSGAVERVVLGIKNQSDDFLPNFRRNDMVYLYAYGDVPDVRKSILLRGTIARLSSTTVEVQLTNSQNNEQVLDPQRPFAIEHAGSDMGGTAALAGLHTLITAPIERRNVLLGQRPPRADKSKTLTRSYHPDYNDVLLRAKQALDFFLLQGPPGTGKTSMALRFLVEEELTNPTSAILLTAYTNRAVDEICGMLCQAHVSFIRLGNKYSCDPQYESHLLSSLVEAQARLDQIRQCLLEARVIVATTSTLMARPFLFSLKTFSLVVVDEASQILEPNIIGMLAATQARFILVGDHKQLPAVVQQSVEESAADSPLLHAIGLYNCRNSLFERLLRAERQAGRTDFVGVLHKQGRMHPDIALYSGNMFYRREQLQPVPLPHQQEPTSRTRVIYINVEPQPTASDKVNPREAVVVAQVLKRVYEQYADQFDADRTVGVIVPYRNQIAMVRQEVEKLGIEPLLAISIDTVERYQGSQREVIVYSFTVQHRYQLDFLTANCFSEDGVIIDRKLNVAITRARRELVLTGHYATLRHHPIFAQLIEDIKQKNAFFEEKALQYQK